jgi:hypothetical protein
MISKMRHGLTVLLLLAAGIGMAHAQALAPEEDADAAAETAASDAEDMADLELDWSQLDVDASTLTLGPASKVRRPQGAGGSDTSWSSKHKANGAADVSVKQALSPFWDARIGADMTVVHQPQTLTSADLLRQKFSPDSQPSQSSGTAWAAVTAPGVGSIWDKTAIEARVDPSQERGKLGTSLSKSLPLSDQYSLTLQNGYNIIQQGLVPVPGIVAHPSRNYQTEQSARLGIIDTGTSFIAGQSLSSTEDKWLRKFGAEQKLFGGVTINGSIGETALGTSNKSLSAGFKHSW